MTQRQLELAISRRTGESMTTIAQRGFGPYHPIASLDLDDDPPLLVLDCPCCGNQVLLAPAVEELPELAECQGCDTLFDYRNDEVYAADLDDLQPPRKRSLLAA